MRTSWETVIAYLLVGLSWLLTNLVIFSFRGEWRLLCAALCHARACFSLTALLVAIVWHSLPPASRSFHACFCTAAWPIADLLSNHAPLAYILILPLNIGAHDRVSAAISSSLASGTPLRLDDWLAVVWQVSWHYPSCLLYHFCIISLIQVCAATLAGLPGRFMEGRLRGHVVLILCLLAIVHASGADCSDCFSGATWPAVLRCMW